MVELEWVNRETELRILEKSYSRIGIERTIFIIHGTSGVGKSRLTKRFLNNIRYPFTLKIEVNKNYVSSPDNSLYIRRIAYELNKLSLSDSRVLSLEKYIKTEKNLIDKEIKEAILDDISKIVPGFKSFVKLGKKLSNKKSLPATIFENTSESLSYMLSNYVKTVFKNGNWILNIENIQQIDSLSLKVLLTIIEYAKTSLFLFEFTDNTTVSIAEFSNLLAPLKIKRLLVKPLEAKDILKIVKNKEKIVSELIQHSLSHWKGNLTNLSDLVYMVDESPDLLEFTNIQNAKLQRYNSLETKHKQFLYLLYSHGGEVSKDIILELATKNSGILSISYSLDYSDIFIQELGDKNKKIRIEHDSVQDLLTAHKDKDRYLLIAYRIWFTYYFEKYNSKIVSFNSGEYVIRLLFYASVLEEHTIVVSLLNESKKILKSTSNKKKILDHIHSTKTKFEAYGESNTLDAIRIWLAENYQNLSMAYDATAIIDEITSPNDKSTALSLILKEMTGNQEEAIKSVGFILKEKGASIAPEFELVIRLVRLQCNYDLDNYTICKKEFEDLIKKFENSNLFSFGFLLRNAELIYNYEDSLEYYKRSIAHFTAFNSSVQSGFSQITLSIHLALLGRFKQAEEALEFASAKIVCQISDYHIYLNNKALLRMYNGKLIEACELLRRALFFAELDFDKCAIISNLIAVIDIIGESDNLTMLIRQIEKIIDSPRFASKRIIWYAEFNIWKYYQSRESVLASSIYSRLINRINKDSSFYEFWIKKKKLKTTHPDYYRFLLQRPFSYLTHWNIEFDNLKMKF